MTTQEARDIVSYKRGLKEGLSAMEDSALLREVVEQAVADKTADTMRVISLKDYMAATKVVNTYRSELARVEGEAWVAQKSQEDGVSTTASGLAYRVLTLGSGELCPVGALVRVHYTGKLQDGTVFDSSYERGEAATFPQNAVIAGWQEGLLLMTVGSIYQFYIPASLAYGERGMGVKIPPHAALFFEVELLALG